MVRPKKRQKKTEGRLRPTIDSLRVLVELGDRIKAEEGEGSRYGSLSEAADALSSSYSKSNVFRALAELRKVYRRQLVNRSTVTLTREGEAVYAWARSLLDLHARGSRWPIGEREEVRIGASSWILDFLVPEVVQEFLTERAGQKGQVPDVDLVFNEFDVEQVLVALRKGTIHAGLAAVWTVEPFPGVVTETLRDNVATVMIAATGHKHWGRDRRKRVKEVTLHDLSGETLCLIEADLHRVLAALPPPVRGQGRVLVENYAGVAALVRAGAAVGFLPALHLGDAPVHPGYQRLEVYTVKEPLPVRKLSILRRAGEDLPEAAEAFLRCAAARLTAPPG